MTISRALGVSQAQRYYKQEYANTRENYYGEDSRVQAEWRGQLADEWGLKGAVSREEFDRLSEGQDPKTGEHLVKRVSARKQLNQYGEEITTSEHRAGWDATFSAPKSVSIAALVGGDERIRVAHQESVDVALVELEKYTQARMGGSRPAQTTGKFIAAKFEHDSARPDRQTGYAAPQLHTHVVIFNLTRTADGKTRSIQPLEQYRSQQYATAIYRMNLAERLQQLGYEIEVDSRTGAPEIRGFSKEYLAANSPRSEEVKREAEGIKQRLAERGIEVGEGAGLSQAAARMDRASKKYNREEMQARHREMEARYGYQAQLVRREAVERGPITRPVEEIKRRAIEAVTFARDNAMEREAVADMRKVRVDALRRNLGLTTYEAVMNEIAERQEAGEFVGIIRENQTEQTTTKQMLKLERSNIQDVLEGKGKDRPIVEVDKAGERVEQIATRRGVKLNGGQRNAVTQILTSRDRIIGLQGGAGTGKTTVLATIKEAAEASGYRVKGLAPTTRAAALLQESGIQCKTIQRFLYEPQIDSQEGRKLYVLDESSLASTKNISRFFDRIGPQDKVLLVGDSRQHQAVEAGSPFEQLQKNGMEAAKLTEIIRQRDQKLKIAVEKLSARQVLQAVRDLEAQGRIVEIPDERERLQAIAAAYCEKPGQTLVISPANQERVAINVIIHRNLQRQGLVNGEDHEVKVYVNRHEMTGAERTFANSYVPGEDIVRYNRNSEKYEIRKGEYGRVIATDHESNTITVRMQDGRELAYNAQRLTGVSVYKERKRSFAEGDRIQFRAPLSEERIANGELGRVEKIEGRQFRIKMDSGRSVAVDVSRFRHLDYGYAVTSYSSQGQTVDRVLVNADTRESEVLVNQRMAYVAVSRAREEVKIFTNCKQELGASLDRAVDKEIALEAVAQASAYAHQAGNKSSEVRQHQPVEERLSRKAHTEAGEGQQIAPRSFNRLVSEYLPQQDYKQEHKSPLVRVTGRNPCPVCEKKSWCSVSADRAIAICMRVTSQHETANGGYLHVLSESYSEARQTIVRQVEVTQYERASVERRDEVNRALNEALTLKQEDKNALKKRGLDEKAIEQMGYKSVPLPEERARIMRQLEGKELAGVPGFYRDKESREWKLNVNEWHRGIMIPVKDVRGKIEGFQIRRSRVDADEPRYVWLSSAGKEEGASSRAPAHYANVDKMKETGEAILTEGALKGNIVASYLDKGVISVQGVTSFQQEFGVKLREEIPELKKVHIAYDADIARKPEVERALERMRESLKAGGIEINILKWEEREGKGLDDYLMNRLGQEFSRIENHERKEKQGEVLIEIGWTGQGREQASRVRIREESGQRQGVERSAGHDQRTDSSIVIGW